MHFMENDLTQGIENITLASKNLQIPSKTILTAKAIFHYVYPKLYKTETLTDVSFISLFVSSKMNETHIKIEALVASINSMKNCVLNKSSFIKCESKIVEKIQFNFEIKHIHMFVIRIYKLLYVECENLNLAILDEIYNSSRVNLINYFGDGTYEPEVVALAYFSDLDIKLIEKILSISIDKKIIAQIRSEVYNKSVKP